MFILTLRCQSPYDASLLLRGIKTIHVRVERQATNAQRLAEYLESRDDKIRTVFYPGLASNPGHVIARRQMKMFGGMISFDMKGGLEAAKTVVEVRRLCSKRNIINNNKLIFAFKSNTFQIVHQNKVLHKHFKPLEFLVGRHTCSYIGLLGWHNWKCFRLLTIVISFKLLKTLNLSASLELRF